jgi:(4-(4-[2-(gamma-L-glutamylamino)ethyl]phenoxymethyl)furan-2-yl)methanamine synthase
MDDAQRTNRVLGLDVGGANLKAAHADGFARTRPFELWKHPDRLAPALRELIDNVPPFDRLAVTMTGELCDCFATRREGVTAILDAVETAARGVPVSVWRTDGRFADVATARREPLPAASANWLALATFAGRFAPDGAVLVLDVGSTTADVIPLQNRVPVPAGRTDAERLRTGELVYTGARRTPVCALLGAEGAAELFATTLDVYLLLGQTAEDENDRGTADGRPATRRHAHARLARMVGADAETMGMSEAVRLAERIALLQSELLGAALKAVVGRSAARPGALVLAGSGEFVARSAAGWVPELEEVPIVSLSEQLGAGVTTAACAYAVAVLCAGRGGDG